MEYLVGIVGERSYPNAVARARAGMRATIVHEPDNPHDALALRVDVDGETVGYIARDHWLRDTAHKSRKTIDAVVHDVPSRNGRRGIVLLVTLASVAPAGRAPLSRPAPRETTGRVARRIGFAALLGRLFR